MLRLEQRGRLGVGSLILGLGFAVRDDDSILRASSRDDLHLSMGFCFCYGRDAMADAEADYRGIRDLAKC